MRPLLQHHSTTRATRSLHVYCHDVNPMHHTRPYHVIYHPIPQVKDIRSAVKSLRQHNSTPVKLPAAETPVETHHTKGTSRPHSAARRAFILFVLLTVVGSVVIGVMLLHAQQNDSDDTWVSVVSRSMLEARGRLGPVLDKCTTVASSVLEVRKRTNARVPRTHTKRHTK